MLFVAFDVSDFKHSFTNHSKEFAKDHNHIRGIDKRNCHLFIKECECRFNHGTPSQKIITLQKWNGVRLKRCVILGEMR